MTTSGATWAPNRVSVSGNNRTHMIRVPANDRFELRIADGAANPYLLQAAVLSAGLRGMEKKVSPEKYYFDTKVNMYKIPDGAKEVQSLPTLRANLLDALRDLEADPDASAMLGSTFI